MKQRKHNELFVSSWNKILLYLKEKVRNLTFSRLFDVANSPNNSQVRGWKVYGTKQQHEIALDLFARQRWSTVSVDSLTTTEGQ